MKSSTIKPQKEYNTNKEFKTMVVKVPTDLNTNIKKAAKIQGRTLQAFLLFALYGITNEILKAKENANGTQRN